MLTLIFKSLIIILGKKKYDRERCERGSEKVEDGKREKGKGKRGKDELNMKC